jgi:hypothetical protein
MRKSAWTAVGAYVLALSLGLGSSGWPEIVRPHSHIVVSLIVFGTICLIFPVLHSLYRWALLTLFPQQPTSPLEIIFEPLNPGRRFWSLESHSDDYKRLIGNFWEHRVEVKNNSSVTLRKVTVTVERLGSLPVKPQSALFVRTKTDSCDINPGCSELVLINRWPHPKQREGFMTSESAWGYGPIKVVASAEDTIPAETMYDFNYETDQMLFERGKY